MATKQKFFGEDTRTRMTKRRQAKRARRAMGRRAKRTARRTTSSRTGFVLIPVPANLAFQLGFTLGQQAR